MPRMGLGSPQRYAADREQIDSATEQWKCVEENMQDTKMIRSLDSMKYTPIPAAVTRAVSFYKSEGPRDALVWSYKCGLHTFQLGGTGFVPSPFLISTFLLSPSSPSSTTSSTS